RSTLPRCADFGCKRGAAASTTLGVGTLKDKSLARHAHLVIERRAAEIQKAFRVHEDARAMLFKDLVAIARLHFEPHSVRQARTAAALHADAQPAGFRRHAFLAEQGADTFRGALSQVN